MKPIDEINKVVQSAVDIAEINRKNSIIAAELQYRRTINEIQRIAEAYVDSYSLPETTEGDSDEH